MRKTGATLDELKAFVQTCVLDFTDEDLVATACNGDIIRFSSVNEGAERNILLHSLPGPERRENVTVYASFDEGQTWPVSKCIVPYDAAYSSLCILPDHSIGLYVEESNGDTLGYSMVFYNFNLK